jgi:hypothetical protein
MQPAAYDRARKLLTPRKGAVLWANILGVVHSLLILAAILLGGAVAALVASRGQAWHPPFDGDSKPSWLGSPIATRGDGQLLYDKTGLYPIVAANEDSANPIHRATARFLGSLLRRVPTLHNNGGALTTLLASGLAIFFALSIVSNLRRASIAEATQEAATSLRRQIHRQLYLVPPFRRDRARHEPLHPRGQ